MRYRQDFPAGFRPSDRVRGCRGDTVPRKVPEGRVLAHNHVARAVDTPCGTNGFRAWTWPKDKVPRGWKRCKCGWSGLPHYRHRGKDKREEALVDRYRCDSRETILSFE